MTSVHADAIFCDDIRQENTGKFLFIGVYPGDLIPSTIPAAFPMAVFLRVHGMPAGNHKFSAKLISPSGAVLFEQEGDMETNSEGIPIVLIFSGFLANIDSAGDLAAKITIDGRDLTAGSLRILPPPQASALTPTS